MKYQKFSHKTPHLKGKKHQLDPNLDIKQLVHHSTVQYVDRDADGDVDVYDNPKKKTPDENPIDINVGAGSKKLLAKQKGELKHTKRGMAYEGSLHKWFKSSSSKDGKPGWVNVVTGGTCASDEPGEGTPKCVSSAKRASMSQAERRSAARRKKEADPGQQQKTGAAKPTYVSTDIPRKMKEETGLVRYCPKCQKNELRSECAYGSRYWDMFSMPPAIMTNQMKYDIAQIHPTNEERDHEYSMARAEISKIVDAARRLKKKMGKGEGNIEAWVQSKITKAADYLDSAADYLDSGEHDIEEEKKKCPEGQYFCNRENKCKPIPKGYHLMPNGAIMKDDEMNEEKGPCWTGYKQVGMKKKGNKMVPNCVPEETAVEEEKDIKGKGSGQKDACYKKVKSRYDVWPSAYASGALVKCRKVGAANWGNTKNEEFENVEESVRIPSKTGNIILVTLSWRGKLYMIKMFFPQIAKPGRAEVQDQISKVYPGSKVQSYYISDIKPGEQFLQTEDWQKVNRKDKTDGLSQKAVDAYRRENPGSKLQTAVTEKNPKGKRAERRKNFCSRMSGMKKRLTSTETARDPDSRINKALRRWNCN
jgi:hypothetical protein